MTRTIYQLAIQRAGEDRPTYHQVSESRLKSSLTATGIREGAHQKVLDGEHVELWGGGPTVWIHSTETIPA